jgi:hypothetical protein
VLILFSHAECETQTEGFLTISGKVTEDLWKLHNEKLRDLYFLPNVMREIKLKIKKWAENVEGMRERRGAAKFCWEGLK